MTTPEKLNTKPPLIADSISWDYSNSQTDHHNSEPSDSTLHKNWRIVLYYYYTHLPNVIDHVQFQKELCETMDLKGRIRVSQEGINGVLSGFYPSLQRYEDILTQELQIVSSSTAIINLDVKYCFLREDLPIATQLFNQLMVKETKTVISLFDQEEPTNKAPNCSRRSKQSNRRRRRKEKERQQRQQSDNPDESTTINNQHQEILELEPAKHLSADEWNEKLLQADNALLLDVRNVYESRIGHFSAPTVPTLLTNTRKYSDLPKLLATNLRMKESQEIFMYCTGGVRCERVSQLVQTLYPTKQVYQLQGGIQRYLEAKSNPEERCLFQGKNFVFDPRRTDPVYHAKEGTVGKCLVCESAHDDYDNGHSPSENKEARCNGCRMLVLICNECRPNYNCWGEQDQEDVKRGERLILYCGLGKCVHEGVKPEPELIPAKVQQEQDHVTSP